jgi:hypothetical protein
LRATPANPLKRFIPENDAISAFFGALHEFGIWHNADQWLGRPEVRLKSIADLTPRGHPARLEACFYHFEPFEDLSGFLYQRPYPMAVLDPLRTFGDTADRQ